MTCRCAALAGSALLAGRYVQVEGLGVNVVAAVAPPHGWDVEQGWLHVHSVALLPCPPRMAFSGPFAAARAHGFGDLGAGVFARASGAAAALRVPLPSPVTLDAERREATVELRVELDRWLGDPTGDLGAASLTTRLQTAIVAELP